MTHPLNNSNKNKKISIVNRNLTTKQSIKTFLHPPSPTTISKLITQFFLPKNHDYNQSVLQYYADTYDFVHKLCLIENRNGEKLYSSLLYKSTYGQREQLQQVKNCIIYCHGYGSTRLQAVHILKVLPPHIALCCFDFSGSGKSQGDIITYGAKQKQDIQSVIHYLRNQIGVQNVILWGRSMGATACLMYSMEHCINNQNHNSQFQTKKNRNSQNIIYQVIDSAFVSFQKIAIEMATKFISVMPEFGTGIVLDMMRQQCKILGQYDPFTVNLQHIQKCKVPTLFIYSEQDEIVSAKNSQYLSDRFMGFYERMVIDQSHNAPRSGDVLSEVMRKIEIQLQKREISKKKGVVFRSFMSVEEVKQNRSGKKKKGINRSSTKNKASGQQNQIQLTQKSSQRQIDMKTPKKHLFCLNQSHSKNKKEISPRIKHNSDYGFEMQAKECMTPNPYVFRMNNHYDNQTNFNVKKVLRYSEILHSSFLHQQPIISSIIQQQNNQNTVTKRSNLNGYKNKQKHIYHIHGPQLKIIKNPTNHVFSEKKYKLHSEFEKGHNQNHQQKQWQCNNKRPQSKSKKLNISLSMMKLARNQKNQETLREKKNPNQQSSFLKMDPNKIILRPISATTNEYESQTKNNHNQHMKGNYVNNKKLSMIRSSAIKTTKNTSLSSSMDNNLILGAYYNNNNKDGKSTTPQTPKQQYLNQQLTYYSNSNNTTTTTPIRCVKKMRSTEIIYYDRGSYRYGV